MSSNKINIAVAGATGYVGLDLIKILSSHPRVIIKYLCAQKKIGKNIQFFDTRIKKKLPKISNLKSVDWNKIDVLFHAVGFVHHGALLDCDTEEFNRSINVNLYSAYLMSHSLLPKMIKQKKGNIIIVSSAASSVKGVPNRFIYATTKAALNGFVKSIAADYIKDGIRSNAILPGTVETPSWEGRVQMADDPIQARKDFIARQAMGRLAQPEEIASMAIYLASDESEFVTGTLNLIDGGWTL